MDPTSLPSNMKSPAAIVVLLLLASRLIAAGQPRPTVDHKHVVRSASLVPLHESSRQSIASEIGGAFMSGSKCDADGNLYIRKLATDRPMLGPVVKIDSDGKRVAIFDPAVFSEPKLDRADAFSPAPDGGLYQVAATAGLKPQIYVVRFSSDGSVGSATRLEGAFEPYAFAAFAGGNLLASGFQRDPLNPSDNGRNFTAVFSPDGRMLAQLSFEPTVDSPKKADKTAPVASAESSAPTMDLSEAEAAPDGNIYALRRSSPALVQVISPAGKIVRTLKISAPIRGIMPSGFHVSGNRLAVSFWDDDKESQTLVVADSQTGRTIATYSDADGLGPSFACYSADEGVFTFLQLGEENQMIVVQAK